jgi:hypothetical protein
MAVFRRERIATRYPSATTPIGWMIPKRRRWGNASWDPVAAEGAIVEVSLTGAAIVAPNRYFAPIGYRSRVVWGDHSGEVVIRRSAPYQGSSSLTLYGVEYVEQPSALGRALFDELTDPAGRHEARYSFDPGAAPPGGDQP